LCVPRRAAHQRFDKLCADGKNSPIVEIDGKVYKKMSIEKASEIVFSKLPKKVK
jgi:hypothetical protein